MPDYQELLKEAYGNDPEAAVAIAVEVYKDAGKYLKAIQAQAKKIVTDIIIETGQDRWKSDAGQVYIGKPSVSVRYDAKALDALCASDDTVKRLLWPHRKESERAGSLTIK
jgi:hypothetical protein